MSGVEVEMTSREAVERERAELKSSRRRSTRTPSAFVRVFRKPQVGRLARKERDCSSPAECNSSR